MNQKFSFKLAALVATFSGTAFCPGGLMPTVWSQTAGALPPIVSPQEAASTKARSKMLAPISPTTQLTGSDISQGIQTAAGMPWKVDPSKYQSAIAPHVPPIVPSNAASSYTAPAASVAPQQATAAPQQQTLEPKTQTTALIDANVQPASAAFAAAPKAQLSTGFSSGGVPIYQTGSSAAAVPVPPMIPTRPVARVARASQGSGSRNAIGSGIQGSAPMFAPATPQATFSGEVMTADPVMPAAPIISPNSEMIVGSGQSVMSAPMQTEPVMFDGSSSIVDGPIIDGGIPIVSGPAIEGECSSCNAGGALGCESGGNCNCGPGGCYNAADITNKAGLYGSVGEARYYSHIEGLYFDRRRGDVTFTDAIRLNGFDGNGGLRLTFGERFDAINGREFSYAGTAPLKGSNTIDGTTFTVPAPFATTSDNRNGISPFGFFTAPVPGLAAALPVDGVFFPALDPIASEFNPADTLTQSKETYFHTLEFNRVRWGWDVFKSFAGIRYVYLDDQYNLTGTNANANAVRPLSGPTDPRTNNDPNGINATTGSFDISASNHLIGPHIGAEFFYDVGYRWSLSLNGKLGVYANFNEVDTRLTADDAAFASQSTDGTAFASSVEAGLTAHYQISPRGRFRVGYNVLHFEDVATVAGNLPGLATDFDGVTKRSINRGTGSAGSDNGRMTFLGLAFGIEIFR